MRLTIHPKHAGGFSLLELVVVLVLIGIMTAVIVPEMRGTYEDELLRSTSRKLVSAVHLANSQAITVNDRHRLRLDSQAGRYHVERVNSESEEGDEFIAVRNVPAGEGPLDKRITIEIRKPVPEPLEGTSEEGVAVEKPTEDSGETVMNSIAFAADGTADDREIVLRDRAGFGLALRVNPTTARVQIIELDRK